MIPDRLRSRLMAVWQRWDEAPGSDDRARNMENVCAAVAVELGVSVNEFRGRLSAGRRAGLSRGAALDAMVGDPPVVP